MKAVIFDMDGVISDTDHIHAELTCQQLKDRKVTITPRDLQNRFAGMKTIQVYETLVKEHGFKESARDLLDKKNVIYKQRLDKELKAIPGAIELIKALHKNNIPLAVASGCEHKLINWTIDGLHLREYFQAIISSDDVLHGKPAPDVFLKAAKELNITPQDCIVIEDGMTGMIGAKAGGMKCVALVRPDDKRTFPADLIIHDLRELTVKKLQEL